MTLKQIISLLFAGEARSGKSSLMNFAFPSKEGFEVGSEMSPVTEGVWMRCTSHPKTVRFYKFYGTFLSVVKALIFRADGS